MPSHLPLFSASRECQPRGEFRWSPHCSSSALAPSKREMEHTNKRHNVPACIFSQCASKRSLDKDSLQAKWSYHSLLHEPNPCPTNSRFNLLRVWKSEM